jgi:hypothetical protein
MCEPFRNQNNTNQDNYDLDSDSDSTTKTKTKKSWGLVIGLIFVIIGLIIVFIITVNGILGEQRNIRRRFIRENPFVVSEWTNEIYNNYLNESEDYKTDDYKTVSESDDYKTVSESDQIYNRNESEKSYDFKKIKIRIDQQYENPNYYSEDF